MKSLISLFILLISFPSIGQAVSDDEIKQHLINNSIRSYSGSCPCPYNTTRAGRRCGKRSAYSRPGGYSPLCYKSDVSDEMVSKYRKRNN